MRKAWRYPDSIQLGVVQSHSEPTCERWGFLANVRGYVEDPSPCDPNEFPLRILELVVKAAQHAVPRSAVIVLHEPDWQVRRGECLLMERLEKKTALVPKDRWHDQAYTRQPSLPDFKLS